MTNREVVSMFYTAYQRHDYSGMHAYLDPRVEFGDLAFESITGAEVRAMWRWFCEPTETRKDPVQVPGFEVLRTEGDRVYAEYWVRYSPVAGKVVNYVIRSEFTVRDGKIVRQIDEPVISNLEFARMATGFPACLLALTPAFKPAIRKKMRTKLEKFTNRSRTEVAASSN